MGSRGGNLRARQLAARPLCDSPVPRTSRTCWTLSRSRSFPLDLRQEWSSKVFLSLNHQLKINIPEAKLLVPLIPKAPAAGEGCAVAWAPGMCRHGRRSEAHVGSRRAASDTPAPGPGSVDGP